MRVLVTGANKGIGLAIVEAILEREREASVLLGSRDRERGEQARAHLVEKSREAADRVEVLELDVSDVGSVRAAAERVAGRHGASPAPLYGIVNNAGIGGDHGLDAMLRVNVLGIRHVCDAFLPLLEPVGGRIVNVTSAAGPSFVARCSEERKRFFTDPGMEWSSLDAFLRECREVDGGADAFAARGLGNGNPYGLSKACANAYTRSLARLHPKLVINACTPGFIETDLTRGLAAAQGKSPAEMGMKSPAEGTRAPLFLLFGAPRGSGDYYGSDALRSPLDRYRAPGSAEHVGD